MDRKAIIDLLQKNTATVLAIDVAAASSSAKLEELGANSMDRMEIVTMTMEEVGVTFPLVELKGADTLDRLADVITERALRTA